MRLFSSLSAALMLLLVGQPAAAVEKNRLALARAKTAKAEKLLTQTEYAGAERLFRKAIALEPKLPTAHLGLGAALVGQQKFDEALSVLERAEEKYVRWEQDIQIASLLKRQVAERQLQTVIDLAAAPKGNSPSGVPNPGSETQDRAGMDRIQTEQFIFRERWRLEAAHAIPAQVFYLEGLSYLRTNQRRLGIEALQICLLIDDRHPLAHYNLAVALFTSGDVAEAKAHLDVAVASGVEPHSKFVSDLEQALGHSRIARQ